MRTKNFSCIFVITFPKAYIVLSIFINNVISQVDTLMVCVGIKICVSNISRFLNFIENSIDWYVHIKIHLFGHIIMLVKHLRCDFSISFEEMLEDEVYSLLGVVSVAIVQSSDVLRIDRCGGLLS